MALAVVATAEGVRAGLSQPEVVSEAESRCQWAEGSRAAAVAGAQQLLAQAAASGFTSRGCPVISSGFHSLELALSSSTFKFSGSLHSL